MLSTINRTAEIVVAIVRRKEKTMLNQCHAFFSMLAVLPFTLMKSMLGNMNVRGMRENEPRKFTKSPIKGNAAATKVFPVKKNARRRNKRFKFSPECMAMSISRNFVSNASRIGATNICWETMDCKKTMALMRTLIHLGPLRFSGRYADTADP
ncbi:hypothetical protein V8G54_017057 [Vigna mungo]|uniref:Uncharacterized protein n=1 Tax=Vigna mungo TaxID=3915 RepID=A0AAQ3RZX7_VIGMU